MRPVNLIPPEERRGTGAPNRTGRAPYAVLAGLALAVAGLALLVTTTASVGDRQAEISSLEVAQRDAQARADALRPFATFAATRQAREATIDSLARSRFDWERVVDELSRVIPADVWLTDLTATASPSVRVADASSTSLRADVEGPALELFGCGRSHDSVAGLIAAIEDIDGVTRVTAVNSVKPDGADGETQGASGGDCQTRNSIASFELIVAFDAAPTGSDPSTTPSASAATSPPPAAATTAPVVQETP